MKTTTKELLTLPQIRKAFEALEHVFYSEMTNWAEELFALCQKEEKGHRGWGPDFAKYHPAAPSTADIARMFACKRVAEYLLKPESYPKGQDYLHFPKSCFMAAGMAQEFGERILAEWDKLPIVSMSLVHQLAELDYCDYVKVIAITSK